MNVLAGVASVVGLLVLVAVLNWTAGRVHRLHRLHVRTDAARDGLRSALARRAEMAARVAEVLGDAGTELRMAAEAARTAGEADREEAENALGARLAGVRHSRLPADLPAELADAEQLVVLARRVYNDAVRDTLALRSRRMVRWFRLAGTAPLPAYFEIADPAPEQPGVTVPAPRPTWTA